MSGNAATAGPDASARTAATAAGRTAPDLRVASRANRPATPAYAAPVPAGIHIPTGPDSDTRTDRPCEAPAGQPTGKTAERATDTAGKTGDKTADSTTDRATVKTGNRTAGRATVKTGNRPADRTTGKPGARPHGAPSGVAAALPAADTVVEADGIRITAIKQGLSLRDAPVAATVAGERTLERGAVAAVKDLSARTPNFHIPDYGSRMTSSIYVRGLGARIDQPVMGMNVDNVPLLNKNNYDFDLADVERIEILRGPQSTLYGRNTMGGVVNVYTRSPLAAQGTRLGVEYGSGNTLRLRASTHHALRESHGLGAALWYGRSDGFFTNEATGRRCDREESGGARIKYQYRGERGLRIENTASVSLLAQGGYPYASALTGSIAYDDPCSYDRLFVSDGLTVRYDGAACSVASVTSYQYTHDDMRLDQDFLPLPYFTLRQDTRQHAVTQEVVVRSRAAEGDGYGWLCGLFGFYSRSEMQAPVLFKERGIEELILRNANAHDPEYEFSWLEPTLALDSRFRTPDAGLALYHESNYRTGRWHFTLGVRLDCEHVRLHYDSRTASRYRAVRRSDGMTLDLPLEATLRGTLRQSFAQVLPKAAVRFELGRGSDLYASVSKGYKAGGYNTQMFSDILQRELMERMGAPGGAAYDIDRVMTYRPEKSWNYELGGHVTAAAGAVRGDFALFRIDCRDQQLTVFPDGTTTGRMMTNAGRTRSLGGEASVTARVWRRLDLALAYGYTHAVFRRYDDGRCDYRGKRIPYAPEYTASAHMAWSIPTGIGWLGDVVLAAGARGVGPIRWNEQNTLTQPFYVLLDASVRLEHPHYTLDLRGDNLCGTHYDTFHFVSMGNAFLQRGRPRTFRIALNIHL